MTEDEAKTKWCPHAVASHTDPRARTDYGREDIGLPADTWNHACIGSACMAWRNGHKRNPDWKPTHQMMVGDPYSRHPDDQVQTYVADMTDGFCGLAGRPS